MYNNNLTYIYFLKQIPGRKFFSIFFGMFLLILNLSSALFAQDPEYVLRKGNTFYQNKQYERAIEVYEHLIKNGYEGTSLYYNLGNAYYRTGKLGFAILNYERALIISPNDEDIQHNLALANSKTIDRIEMLPRFFIFQWWEGLLALFNLTGWTYASYTFYIVVLISAAFYFFAKNQRLQKISFYTGLTAVLFLLFTASILIIKFNRELSVKNAVIVESEATVKLSPDSAGSDAFIIHEGLKVKLEDNVQEWVKIRLLDGKVGWIEKQNLRII
jgi:tetratricopeptide (TPR) repeat protein